MNFFDEPDSPEGSGANDSFFSQPSPVRGPAFAAARVSSVTGDTTASSFRDSSIFDRESNDRTIDRTRDESVSLEDILGTGKQEQSGTDVQELMRSWRNERAAPELLVFPLALVNRLTLNLAKKKETVDRLNSVENQPESNYVKLSIAATENMRADFTLKSFLRARLYKIEQFAQALMEDEADARERLSPMEFRLCETYLQAWSNHLNSGAMNDMPEKTRGLDDQDMIPIPNLSRAVFIRVRRKCPPVTLPDGEKMELPKDSQHMLRYSTIRELLRQGMVELI